METEGPIAVFQNSSLPVRLIGEVKSTETKAYDVWMLPTHFLQTSDQLLIRLALPHQTQK